MSALPKIFAHPARRYAMAVLVTVLAVAIRYLLDPALGDRFPFAIVFIAVLLVARFGGFGPSAVAAAGGFLGCWYLFVNPRYTFSTTDAPGLLFYVVIITITVLFGRAMHLLHDRAAAAAAEADEHRMQLEHEVQVRRRAEEALKDADRRKDEFLAMLAHELRNPLAPVRNAVHLLKAEPDPETEREARAIIERQVEHLVRLVDDLLDVSRILRGRIELRREPMDLAEAVQRAIEIARPTIDAGGHKLTLKFPAEAMILEGDLVRLTQVVANLLTNAAKYTLHGGEISITAERAERLVHIHVQDTGIGIAPDLLPRVFDLFVQGDRSAARTQGGLGIGLTLVRQLVEMHGGSVAVDSKGIGHGSQFTITLPLLTSLRIKTPFESNGKAAAVGGVQLQGPPLRVLVVDDNSDAAESLASVLRLNGHVVRTAHNGPDALQTAPQFQPHAVVLDIGLPGMDGHEVAKSLRSQSDFARTVLVAVTGYGQDADKQRSAAAGFDRHFVKPVDPVELGDVLWNLSKN
jgi:signal transduction histidine kinase/ActR/RegA family two-component response regulator